MAHEKLAESLEALHALQAAGRIAIRSQDLSRTDRERLQRNGFLQEVIKGWYVPARPDETRCVRGAGSTLIWWAQCGGRSPRWSVSQYRPPANRGRYTRQHAVGRLRCPRVRPLLDLLRNEPHAAVRVVLGHFIFVYIHPYMDGNGRIGRFLMNAMLASGGYRWTVIPVEKRADYLSALEAASVDGDIGPFANFLAGCVVTDVAPVEDK